MGRVNLQEFRALRLFVVDEELWLRILKAFASDPDMVLQVPRKGFFEMSDTGQIYRLVSNEKLVAQRQARLYWKTRCLDLSIWSMQSTDGESFIWKSVNGETKEIIIRRRCNRTCAACSKQEVYMERCGRCLSVNYCSKSHQKSDWQQHKKTCRQ